MRNLAADLAMKIRNTDLQVREYLTWANSQREEKPKFEIKPVTEADLQESEKDD